MRLDDRAAKEMFMCRKGDACGGQSNMHTNTAAIRSVLHVSFNGRCSMAYISVILRR